MLLWLKTFHSYAIIYTDEVVDDDKKDVKITLYKTLKRTSSTVSPAQDCRHHVECFTNSRRTPLYVLVVYYPPVESEVKPVITNGGNTLQLVCRVQPPTVGVHNVKACEFLTKNADFPGAIQHTKEWLQELEPLTTTYSIALPETCSMNKEDMLKWRSDDKNGVVFVRILPQRIEVQSTENDDDGFM